MNKAQIDQIRTYLYSNLDLHIQKLQEEITNELKNNTKLAAPLKALHAKTDKAIKDYHAAVDKFNKENKKGYYVYTPSPMMNFAVTIQGSSQPYARTTQSRGYSQTLHCYKVLFPKAFAAAQHIERFLLQAALNADADTVENFLNELLAGLKK